MILLKEYYLSRILKDPANLFSRRKKQVRKSWIWQKKLTWKNCSNFNVRADFSQEIKQTSNQKSYSSCAQKHILRLPSIFTTIVTPKRSGGVHLHIKMMY